MDPYGPLWTPMDPYGPLWTLIGLYGSLYTRTASLDHVDGQHIYTYLVCSSAYGLLLVLAEIQQLALIGAAANRLFNKAFCHSMEPSIAVFPKRQFASMNTRITMVRPHVPVPTRPGPCSDPVWTLFGP